MSTRSAKPVADVYVLEFDDEMMFVGSSSDVGRRLQQHVSAGLITQEYADVLARKLGRGRLFKRR